MAKVICTLPNASELINDVKFAKHELGVISEDITAEVAESFLSIPGYISEEEGKTEDTGAIRAELEARAEAVGLTVKSVWGNERLQSEVEKAEKAAAATASTK